ERLRQHSRDDRSEPARRSRRRGDRRTHGFPGLPARGAHLPPPSPIRSVTMLLLLLSCAPDDSSSDPVVEQPWNPDHETTAVGATVARDYSVGALATVDVDTRETREELATISGDARLAFDDG